MLCSDDASLDVYGLVVRIDYGMPRLLIHKKYSTIEETTHCVF